MKKNSKSTAQKKAAVKRANKRTSRAKRTQSEKHLKKMIALEQKRKIERKQDEEMMKLLQSRQENIV